MRVIRRFFMMIYEKLRNSRLQIKMSLLIFSSVLLPLSIALILFNGFAKRNLAQQMLSNAQNAYKQVFDIFNSRFDVVHQDMLLMLQDSNIRTLLQGTLKDQDILELIQNKALINTTLDYIQNEAIWDMRIRIYVDEDKSLLVDDQRFLHSSNVDKQDWYKDLVSNPYKNKWIYDTDDMLQPNYQKSPFSYIVRVSNPTRFLETQAVIRFDFSAESVRNSLVQSLPANHGAVCLMDKNGVIFAYENRDLDSSEITDLSRFLVASNNEWNNYSIASHNYYVKVQRFNNTPWYLVYMFENTDSANLLFSNSQWMIILLVTIALGAFVLITAAFIARRIAQRVTLVSNHMSSLRNGVLQAIPPSDTHDELGMLIDSYNYLKDELNMLKTAHAMAVSNQRHAEMVALQAQINPHFLYNTLEMVNYFAMIGNAKQVERIVILLSRFYKRCLNKGEENSTLQEELELTDAYCSIQDIRYNGKIHFLQAIPVDLLPCQIPHIVLQPIIENAIHHGIMKKEKQEGTIRIIGEREGEMLHLSIIDDGVGMTAEQLCQLNEGIELHPSISESRSHFGLRNVNARLVSLYGPQAGLKYQSKLGFGSTITIIIPLNPVRHI